MNNNNEIHIVLKYAGVCYVVCLLLAVVLLKGKLSVWGFEGCHKSRGHPPFCMCLNCGPSTRSACTKVCYLGTAHC